MSRKDGCWQPGYTELGTRQSADGPVTFLPLLDFIFSSLGINIQSLSYPPPLFSSVPADLTCHVLCNNCQTPLRHHAKSTGLSPDCQLQTVDTYLVKDIPDHLWNPRVQQSEGHC